MQTIRRRLWLTVPLIAVAILVFAAVTNQPVSAHVLERDGAVSAVLHMPPDDAPVSGQPTSLNLAFATGRNNFDIANYQAKVEVHRGGRTIQTVILQPLNQSATDASATVNLPETGAYQLLILGASLNGGDSFKLQYDIRAGGPAGQSTTTASGAGFDFWAISAGSLAILAIIARSRIRSGGRYIPN